MKSGLPAIAKHNKYLAKAGNRAVGLPTVAKHGKYLAKVGKLGEDIAARFLSRKGYEIVERNVKMFLGEIDIVARKKNFIVFVEVKTRKSNTFGPPYLSITKKKKKKLVGCALCYLKMRGISELPRGIDVISVELDEFTEDLKKIEHFEDAVEDERR